MFQFAEEVGRVMDVRRGLWNKGFNEMINIQRNVLDGRAIARPGFPGLWIFGGEKLVSFGRQLLTFSCHRAWTESVGKTHEWGQNLT